VSQPGPKTRPLGTKSSRSVHVGSDYPHNEGTYPFTREHLRQLFHDTDPAELQQLLAGNAARLYGFDLEALAPIAARVGRRRGDRTTPRRVAEKPNEAPAQSGRALDLREEAQKARLLVGTGRRLDLRPSCPRRGLPRRWAGAWRTRS